MPNTKIYLHNIDLSQNQLINAVLENADTAPVNPVDGQIYYNTVDKQIYFYNAGGSNWQSLDSEYKNSSWYTTTNNAAQWDQAYSWGDHSQAGYTSIPTGTGLVNSDNGVYSFVTNNSTFWNQAYTELSAAYSWGNHALMGYVTSNLYTANGTLSSTRVVTGGDKAIAFTFTQPAANYTFTIGTPTGLGVASWPATFVRQGEFNISTTNTAEPENSRYWGRNQTTSLKTLYVNQSYADVTAETVGGAVSIYNQNLRTYRGSPLDISTTASTSSSMYGIYNLIGHGYTGTALTTAQIYTQNVNAYRGTINNNIGTIVNAVGIYTDLQMSIVTTAQNSTITNYYGIYVSGVIGATSGPTAALTNYIGVYLPAPTVRTTGTITNRWGIYANDSVMNHYIQGNVLIGSTTNSGLAKLQVTGSIQQSDVVSSLLKADSTGKIVAAVAGLDYYTLPAQPGAGTYYLSSDGVTASWVNTSVLSQNIYNTDGSLTGDRTIGSGSGPFKLILQPSLDIQGKVSGFTSKSYTFLSGSSTTVNSSFHVENVLSVTPTVNESRVLNFMYGSVTNNATTATFSSITGAQIYLQGNGTNVNNGVSLTGLNVTLERGAAVTEVSTNANSSMVGANIYLGTNSTATSPFTVGTAKMMNVFNQFISGTFTNIYGIHNYGLIGRTSVSRGVTVSNYYGYYSSLDVGWSSGLGGTITNAYAIYLSPYVTNTTGTIVNRWGIYAPDSYANHYLNSNLLIGTTTPSGARVQVVGAIQQSNALSSMLKADNAGILVAATLGIDYSVIPSHVGQSQKFLYSDGTGMSWQYITETDPIYTASSWYTTPNYSTNWNTAYSWGNHASVGYVTKNLYTENGSLTSNRTVAMGSYTLTFDNDIYVGVLRIGKGNNGNTNIVFGNGLGAVTTGIDNTAIGFSSLAVVSSGYQNVGIGSISLLQITTGYRNVGIGNNAIREITTGFLNTAVGYNTGRGIITGSYNTIIGAGVTGLPSALNNNVIIADGQGNIRIRVYEAGDVVIAGATNSGLAKLQVTGAIQQSSVLSSLLKVDANGVLVSATAGVDYQTPITLSGLNGVPTSRTLTINGTAYDLSADRSWTISTVGSDTNIYNTNGELFENRTMAGSGFTLTLNPSVTFTNTTLFQNTITEAGASSYTYYNTRNTVDFTRTNDNVTSNIYSYNSVLNLVGTTANSRLTGYGYYSEINRTSASDISTSTANIFYGFYSKITQNGSAKSSALVRTFYGQPLIYQGDVTTVDILRGLGTVGLSTSSATVTNYYGVRLGVQVGWTSGVYTGVITNHYGIYLETPTVNITGSITNRWGIYAPDSAMNHYFQGSLNIGTATVENSAILNVSSTTKGFLPPRMTASDKTNITNPAAGLIIYQTDGVVGLYIYNGSGWKALTMV